MPENASALGMFKVKKFELAWALQWPFQVPQLAVDLE
jgi:hypothetical protein